MRKVITFILTILILIMVSMPAYAANQPLEQEINSVKLQHLTTDYK